MNKTKNQSTHYDAQIRLTLPSDWVQSLNQIAQSKCISRLALIRLYLQASMHKDLEEIKRLKALS